MDSMSMAMSMAPTATSSMADMAMSTSDPMSMSSDTMMMMNMVFTVSSTTPLYSNEWTPTTTGQYAGTCIFLIVLSVIFRSLYAYKSGLERKWLRDTMNRRYVRIAAANDNDSESERDATAIKPSAVLTTHGVREDVKILERNLPSIQPWRLSVDLPRAILVTIIVGIGYLLMLAVMTYNVGYFLSVLGGVFLGELFVGRFSGHLEDHH